MLDRKSIEIIHLQSLKNQENHNGEDERKQCAKETSSQFQRKITELELKKKKSGMNITQTPILL